jgi:hypothetical protein
VEEKIVQRTEAGYESLNRESHSLHFSSPNPLAIERIPMRLPAASQNASFGRGIVTRMAEFRFEFSNYLIELL